MIQDVVAAAAALRKINNSYYGVVLSELANKYYSLSLAANARQLEYISFI